ncbi:MFS transporter [Sporosarcina obsidiansis]|uniref:MFS transporter n=1 Tax=Sporosarcina obsidiansis TaxID=2660748 RepID=UPI00129BBB99|nr:MFS transporter [Sporosarcina obsidiansis]
MPKKEPIWTKAFLSIFCTNFSVFIVFYGLVSALPLFVTGELNRTDEDAGLLMTIYLLSAILVRPFSGKILDVFGKRKMLWISLIFYLLCTSLYYFIEPFAGLLVLRFVHGIWFSIATTASGSLAADFVPMKRRGAGLGYYTMSTNLAVVVGPMIALSIVQSFSFDALFLTMSVLVTVGAMFALFLPADRPLSNEKSFTIKLGDLFEKNALPVSLLASLISFAYASVLSYLSIFAQQKGVLAFASTFFLVFAAVMLLTRPFTGRIFDEKGPNFIIIPGMFLFMIGLLLLAVMNSAWLFLVAAAFIGLGYGALVPSLQTLAVQSTSHERSGYATATFFTLFDTGLAIGSYVLGLIAVYAGYQRMYFMSAVILFAVGIFYVLYKRRAHQQEQDIVEN